MKLRPYQDSAIESVLDAWAIEPRVCLAMPTGTGKTVVAAGLCLRAKAEGLRGAFVTDRLTLLPQTRRTFEACGLRIATIQGSNTSSDAEIAAADVLLCSAQTLDSRRMTAESLGIQFAIVDECHIEREVVRALACERAVHGRPDRYPSGALDAGRVARAAVAVDDPRCDQ